MIRALIVDDELFARDNLKRLLELYCKEVDVCGTANSVESALSIIPKLQPELVFLDVHLAKDTSFSILNELSEINFSIIFTSGYANYAVDAFKVNAIDYLLKPVDSDDLMNAIQKYKNWKLITSEKVTPSISIKVHHKDVVTYISATDIIALTADDNYTTILTSDNRKYNVPKTLKEFESLPESDVCFIRISRSVIINTKFVVNYAKNQPYTITMSTNQEFEISRRRRSEVINLLKEH
jgi:two-component system LytT family response regulator